MAELLNRRLVLIESTIAHAELLAALHAACFDTAWSVKDFQELLILPTVFGFIAQEMNEQFDPLDKSLAPMGFILCSAAVDECEILTIGVLPQWRRQRVADRLLEQVFVNAEGLGVDKIFLEVAENNNPACELYIANDFREIGRRAKYYQAKNGPVDALILSKMILGTIPSETN